MPHNPYPLTVAVPCFGAVTYGSRAEIERVAARLVSFGCVPIGEPGDRCSDTCTFAGLILAAADAAESHAEPPPTEEPPCSSPTASYVASDPVCVGLLEDVTAAVLASLPPQIPGPIGATGLQGFSGPIGPIGPVGLTGTFPAPGQSDFARFLEFLGVQVGQLLGSRSGSSLPASPPTVTINRTVIQNVPLERVSVGGTISQPVVRGSASDPSGILRPRFPPPSPGRGPILLPPPRPLPGIPPAGRLPERIPGVFHGAGILRFLGSTIVPFLAARQRQKERLELQRRARARASQGVSFNINLIGGLGMPFGQAGFMGSDGGGGDLLGGLSQLLTAATPSILGLFGPQAQGGGFQQAGFAAAPAIGAIARQLPGVLGGLVLGEGLEAVTGGGAMGGLFRPTASRVVPVPQISMIGPDGKCHTWLHATPKGWKINRANVTGRRRHHHHPR